MIHISDKPINVRNASVRVILCRYVHVLKGMSITLRATFRSDGTPATYSAVFFRVVCTRIDEFTANQGEEQITEATAFSLNGLSPQLSHSKGGY